MASAFTAPAAALICPQCGRPIDTTQPYDEGGRPGHFDLLTRPCHIGCEMPFFTVAPRLRVIGVPWAPLPLFDSLEDS
jgi:hypothetical protein